MGSARWTWMIVVGLAVAVLGAGGCASTGGGGGAGDRNVLTSEDLQGVANLDAYQAVSRLRSPWLRGRGGQEVSVYVNGVRRAGTEDLRMLDTADVEEIRFLSATEATTRFGTDNVGGAILVTTRR